MIIDRLACSESPIGVGMIIDNTGGKAHYVVLNAHDELVNYSI